MSWRHISLMGVLLSVLSWPAMTRAADGNAPRHEGVATCASSLCHGSSKPLQAYDALQNEYTTWSQFDPHSGAYRTLLSKESQEIARRMGIGPAHQAPACLACHADAVPAAQRGPRFQIEDGIGCEGCHGGAEKWLSTHYQKPRIPRAESLAQGLVPLEQTRELTRTCLACHVGENNRFANHQMMAAGHPRLVFELDSYLELWRTSGGREHYRKKPDLNHASLWAKGLVESSRRQLDLIEQHGSGRRGPLADFSVFACHSCHRDLKLTDWRGSSALGVAPGDLRWQDAHLLVLQRVAVALRLGGAAELAKTVTTLQRAAHGDAAMLRTALAESRASLATIDGQLATVNWNATTLNTIVGALAESARQGSFPDPAAAEQAAMGMVVMLSSLQVDSARRADINRLFDVLKDDNAFDQRQFIQWMKVLEAR